MLTFRGHSLLSFDSEEKSGAERILHLNLVPKRLCTMRSLVGGVYCAELTQLVAASDGCWDSLAGGSRVQCRQPRSVLSDEFDYPRDLTSHIRRMAIVIGTIVTQSIDLEQCASVHFKLYSPRTFVPLHLVGRPWLRCEVDPSDKISDTIASFQTPFPMSHEQRRGAGKHGICFSAPTPLVAVLFVCNRGRCYKIIAHAKWLTVRHGPLVSPFPAQKRRLHKPSSTPSNDVAERSRTADSHRPAEFEMTR